MKKLVFVFLALGLFLAACAVQKVPLKSGVKLSSVAVAEEVGVADEIYFVGKGAAFGVVGALANASSADQFKNFIVENRIDIKDIVRNAFFKNLQAANRFKVDATAKNCIKLNVKVYGLNNISLLTDEYEPVLLVQAEMVDENNEVIWKGGHYVQPLGNPVAPVSMKLIKANPALVAKMLEAAAEFASQKTIEQL